MKTLYASEFKLGDKCITRWGDIVTIEKIYSNAVEIKENIYRKLYIPGHGEIEIIKEK